VLVHAAGTDLADLEFCQFHPTALAPPGSDYDGTLLTEALRGEGAALLDASGRRFTDELAPRDQLTAAILDRMDADGTDHVRLDLRAIEPGRFPNVFAACREAGLTPEREAVPVAPAAHYLIGGVLSDLYGRTTLPGLYAVGECACTGVHGANRLASNSLTECFVFGARAAEAAVTEPPVAHGRPCRGGASRRPPRGRETRCGAWPGRGAGPPSSNSSSPTPTQAARFSPSARAAWRLRRRRERVAVLDHLVGGVVAAQEIDHRVDPVDPALLARTPISASSSLGQCAPAARGQREVDIDQAVRQQSEGCSHGGPPPEARKRHSARSARGWASNSAISSSLNTAGRPCEIGVVGPSSRSTR